MSKLYKRRHLASPPTVVIPAKMIATPPVTPPSCHCDTCHLFDQGGCVTFFFPPASPSLCSSPLTPFQKCPDAPKKKSRRISPTVPVPSNECDELTISGAVGPYFLMWRPEEISEFEEAEFVETIRRHFCPDAQPHTMEEVCYCELMINACNKRLDQLYNL